MYWNSHSTATKSLVSGLAALIIGGSLTMSACGGGGSTSNTATPNGSGSTTNAPTTTGGASTAAPTAPGGTPDKSPGATVSGATTGPQPVVLDKTVWWSPDRNDHGLVKIHFTQAQIDRTASIPTLTLSYTAENLQRSTRYFSFGSESVLTVNGKSASQPQGKQIQLSAGGTGEGTVVFQIVASMNLDDAVLTLGDPDSNQSIVPLRASAAVTTTQPKTGFVSGTLKGPDHDLAISSSILYADTTVGQRGKSVLALTVKAKYTGPGGGLIGTSNFSLKMPNGSSTPGVQIVGEPLEPLNDALNPGETSPSQLLGFEVDQPSSGTYTLTYTSSQGDDQGKTAVLSFNVGS